MTRAFFRAAVLCSVILLSVCALISRTAAQNATLLVWDANGNPPQWTNELVVHNPLTTLLKFRLEAPPGEWVVMSDPHCNVTPYTGGVGYELRHYVEWLFPELRIANVTQSTISAALAPFASAVHFDMPPSETINLPEWRLQEIAGSVTASPTAIMQIGQQMPSTIDQTSRVSGHASLEWTSTPLNWLPTTSNIWTETVSAPNLFDVDAIARRTYQRQFLQGQSILYPLNGYFIQEAMQATVNARGLETQFYMMTFKDPQGPPVPTGLPSLPATKPVITFSSPVLVRPVRITGELFPDSLAWTAFTLGDPFVAPLPGQPGEPYGYVCAETKDFAIGLDEPWTPHMQVLFAGVQTAVTLRAHTLAPNVGVVTVPQGVVSAADFYVIETPPSQPVRVVSLRSWQTVSAVKGFLIVIPIP